MSQHDTSLMAGSICAGCESEPGEDRYLVVAGTGPAMHVCGHYLAEHVTADRNTADDLMDALIARLPHVELHRSSKIITSRTRYAADAADPCRFCGDTMSRWTRQVVAPLGSLR